MSENNIEIEELKNSLKSALHEVSVPFKEIDFTRENYNKLFPYSKVNSPIETVKLVANQFEKLEKKERQKILQAVHDTLATPDMIINEEKEDVFGEKENSHLYAKSYIIDDKIHGIQSVVVSIDGENVSISTHEPDINNIVNKIQKPDQLLYVATEVRLLVERATGKQLVTVNPNRDSEYVASLIQNISQNQTLSTSTAKTEYGAKRKIYLSGKITGDEGFAEKFKAKEDELTERGDYVFNPALHPDMFTHGQFMQIDLLALSFCDSIYLMDNWRDSKGAKMEFEQAKVLGLDVEFEKELYILLGAVGYYSDKSDEFDIFNSEDISANDMFDTKEAAEQAQKRLLHKEAGNVEIFPASEIFGKRKNGKDISKEKHVAVLRYAPEAFIRDVQEAIAPNPYMSETEIIQTAKDILFERDIVLGLEDTHRLNGIDRSDYTAKERDEINEALIALGGTQNIVDILKNTDPADVKPLMDSRKLFEMLLDKNGIKHSTNKDGSYKLDYGSVIFDTTNIIFYNPKYPSKQPIGAKSYINMKDLERTSELVQRTVLNIAKFRNQQVEKKTTITKANKFLNNKEKTMKNTEKDITAKELQNYIENLKIKYPSKWAEAVKEDAVDLVGNYIEWHGEDAPFKAENVKDLLNGAKDWKQYSQGGLGLIYDVHIAQHYCTQSELKKLGFKEGDGIIKAPNAKELWPDIQARALFQASELIKKSVRDIELNRGLGIEQKSSAKAKEEDFGMER